MLSEDVNTPRKGRQEPEQCEHPRRGKEVTKQCEHTSGKVRQEQHRHTEKWVLGEIAVRTHLEKGNRKHCNVYTPRKEKDETEQGEHC